jgi:hypothetical protein
MALTSIGCLATVSYSTRRTQHAEICCSQVIGGDSWQKTVCDLTISGISCVLSTSHIVVGTSGLMSRARFVVMWGLSRWLLGV